MSEAGSNELTYALEGVLFPTLIIYVVGWILGAIKVLGPPAVFAINMTVLYFILPCAVFSGFLTYRLLGPDFLFMVPNIIDKILSFIPAFVPYFFGKINLRMACTLWLTGVYSNALSYGNYFLYVYYTGPMIPTYCSLSSIPDNVLFFPIVIFMLEYSDYKKQKAEDATSEKVANTSGWKIFLSVLWRVCKTPIVWACFAGIILNQAVLAPGGKFPTWFARFFTLGAQTTLPISMFLLGVFTSTYEPIHKNVMRFFCFIVKPICNLCCAKSVEDTTPADPASNSNSVKTLPTLLAAEEGRGNRDSASDPSTVAPDAPADAVTSPTSSSSSAPASAPAPVPAPAPAPPAAAAAAAPPKDAAAAVNSADYKFNWILTIVEIVIRHFICPGLMIILCLIFGKALPVLQKHALILIASLGTPGVVFSVSRMYNAYPGEAAITQVFGSFIMTLPVFLLFYYITRAIFPM